MHSSTYLPLIMPLLYDKTTSSNHRLAIWQVTEPLDFFKEGMTVYGEEQQLLEKAREHKLIEWYASRYLLHRITDSEERPPCLRDDFGKPFLRGIEQCVSISHSDDLVSACIGDGRFGIDLQVYRQKIARIGQKFVNAVEEKQIDVRYLLDYLHLIWGAKEGMYKAYGMKGIRFKEHLHVQLPHNWEEEGKISGRLEREELIMHFDIFYRKLGRSMLVLALQK